jgi:hypothetical protein
MHRWGSTAFVQTRGCGRRASAKGAEFQIESTLVDTTAAALPKPSRAGLKHDITYLSRRWAEGCVRGRELLCEIKLRGYTGSFSHLERLLAKWRRANDCKVVTSPPIHEPRIAPTTMAASCAVDPATGWSISPIVAASLCIKPRGLLTPRQAAQVDALKTPRRTSPPCVGSPCDPEAFSEAKTFRNSASGSMTRNNPASTQCNASLERCGEISTPSQTR